MGEQAPSERVTVRRHAERGRYDSETINTILDEGLICHLGVNIDGVAMVIPTMYARAGSHLYVHGAVANRALKAMRDGVPASLVVTLLDGLVMARSAFNHSMNYRSVVVVSAAREVIERDEKLRAMEALLEHVAPGRWADARQPTDAEMASTVILALGLDEASAKVRTGLPTDDANDIAFPTWAGVIPLRMASGRPLTAPDSAVKDVPGYAGSYDRP